MSRHVARHEQDSNPKPAPTLSSRFALASADASRAAISLLRRYPAITGTVLVTCAYGLMNLGWRDTAEAAVVYFLGTHLLAALSRGSARGRWLPLAWNLAFVADLGVKAFLIAVYKSRPDAALVIEAISNTNSDESAEFLMNYWLLLGTYTLQLSVLAVLLFLATKPEPGHRASRRRGLVTVGIVFALLHLHPGVRRANPLVFWPVQAATVEEFRANVDTLRRKRDVARAQLPQWAPTYAGPERHTVGLVIGESTNRWNWQLYGYPRPTTPELMQHADEMLVFRDVISAASSTVSSLRQMLTPRSLNDPPNEESLPSVLMLAHAAGYKVFWISNQHDRYITARFAEEADVQKMLNKGAAPGTGGSLVERSLDEVILPEWKAALADPAPRKLIIAHLMGAHAHYDLRCPDELRHFETADDAIDHKLEAEGRPLWVRTKRDQYDDAMLYQDHVISQLLKDFQQAVHDDGGGAWLYTSDHAEEVGHTRNFTGHSPDEAGQVVPMLLWRPGPRPDPALKAELESRPFQTDVLDWTLLDLMHVQTQRDSRNDMLLAREFLPRPRTLSDGSPYRPTRLAAALP
jgi:heptose-I-phosphate ethanolaminephosphotransferase